MVFIATLGISFLDRSKGRHKGEERKNGGVGGGRLTREVENLDTTDADTSRASGSSRGSRY